MNEQEVIETYQCTGCVDGSYPHCFTLSDIGKGCGNHCAGTFASGIGKLFLGMPKGFNRVGADSSLKLEIFESFEDGEDYNKFNVPTWKYLNAQSHTLVRGHRPRTNTTFLHVYLENCMDKVNCYKVTKEDMDYID